MTAAALLLSDQQLLNRYLQSDWPHPEQIRQRLFQALREQQPFQPDYAIEACIVNAGLSLDESARTCSYTQLLLSSLEHLASSLQLRGSHVHVLSDDFERWQQMLTSVMPLSILSFFAFSKKMDENQAKVLFNEWFSHQSCLPAPYLPELVNIFEDGVSEHHLHIMGTSENDYVWQDALRQPKATLSYLAKAHNCAAARQQLMQVNPEIKFSDLYRLLLIASELRQTLLEMMQGHVTAHSRTQLQDKLRSWPTRFSSHHPASAYTATNNPFVNEALLLFAFYRHLAQTRSEVAARCLHIYLLLQSLFNRLLNQQPLDKGFQQFEKITQNELREATEERFQQRFEQLQGMYGNHFNLLEVRFAPKDDVNKLRKLLKALNKGYKRSTFSKQVPFTLTAHFIKAKDKPKLLHPCRDYPLRLRLQKQKKILCHYLQKNPKFKQRVVGIDAAGNELHAGADVFAPLYRQLRSEGVKHFTYHAGEDFKHLLSGMRQIFEAIHYLDLQPGDRIGHATAVGIEPTLWQERAAARQQISKGEWLDTLLFTHHLLLETGDAECIHQAYKLENTIQRLGEIVFSRHDLNIQALTRAWLNRWRDPLTDDYQLEPGGMAGAILTKWHTPEAYERARELLSVETNILSCDIYRKMQENLIEIVCQKQIALEVLPTSNLRISYYKNYAEHHIYRWLKEDAINRPTVVMGSDDPGIFATNIFNEYAHVFINAKKYQPGSSHEPIEIIRTLIENGHNFGFRV